MFARRAPVGCGAQKTRDPLGSVVTSACLSNKIRRPTLCEKEGEVLNQLLALFLLPDIKSPALAASIINNYRLPSDVSPPRNFIVSLAREDNRRSSAVFTMRDNTLGGRSDSFNPYLYYSLEAPFCSTPQGRINFIFLSLSLHLAPASLSPLLFLCHHFIKRRMRLYAL